MQCQKLKTYVETGRVVFLPARTIKPNPAQPRKIFCEEALQELAQSILQHGILQPLSVRRVGLSYELIAGERRLRAAQLAGLTEIPCIVMNMDDRESGLTALVENLQRQDLDFIEEARGISYLIEKWSMSQEQAARTIGKSQCPGAFETAHRGGKAGGHFGDRGHENGRGPYRAVHRGAAAEKAGHSLKTQCGGVPQLSESVAGPDSAIRHSGCLRAPGDRHPDRADHHHSKIEGKIEIILLQMGAYWVKMETESF